MHTLEVRWRAAGLVVLPNKSREEKAWNALCAYYHEYMSTPATTQVKNTAWTAYFILQKFEKIYCRWTISKRHLQSCFAHTVFRLNSPHVSKFSFPNRSGLWQTKSNASIRYTDNSRNGSHIPKLPTLASTREQVPEMPEARGLVRTYDIARKQGQRRYCGKEGYRMVNVRLTAYLANCFA